MQALHKAVQKGVLEPLPTHFSPDLTVILKTMIVTNAEQRLSAKEILEHPLLKKRCLKYYPDQYENETFVDYKDQSLLLKTIRMTKNMNSLINRLPNANYESKNE